MNRQFNDKCSPKRGLFDFTLNGNKLRVRTCNNSHYRLLTCNFIINFNTFSLLFIIIHFAYFIIYFKVFFKHNMIIKASVSHLAVFSS